MAKGILDPNFLAIESIFKQSCFNVPIYQRPYSWDKEQVETLLDDIDTQFKKDKEVEYYMGNIIIFDKGQKTNGVIINYDIIDGQQRTVTFSLLFLAIYCLASRLGFGEDREIANLKDIIWHPIDRKNSRETRLVKISSIEKDCYENLYNQCFDKPIGIVKFCKEYETKSMFEKRIIDNFLQIYGFLEEQYADKMYYILDYTNYLLNKVKLIQIEASCSEKDVFSMFESINSKGKQLDAIDIIKSYIFSMLDADDYDECSKIWGKLTIETNDNLYNYLYVYIRANLFYYKQRFSIAQFKSLCENNLKEYFKVSEVSAALKKLLEDLDAKLNEYKMLESLEKAEKYFSSAKFKFFYSLFLDHKYEHPRALFFRIFNDYNKNDISKEDAISIINRISLMMFEFMTVLGRDSKDCVNVFARIMENIHETGKIDKDAIKAETDTLFKTQNITNEIIINQLSTTDTYNNRVAVPILALYDSTTTKDSLEHVSYDEAYAICSSYSEILSLDHMLVQTPDKDNGKFRYYKNTNTNTLCLKNGNDFPLGIVNEGMDYDDFVRYILNRVGNLRIWYRDKNSSRQNTAIDLPAEADIFTFGDIEKRSEKILNTVFNDILADI